ncbi:MAG: zinc-ribbon domain containing protein [Dehalococcoidia bacterium]|nr:MAG: zinc-ribbon domain containing protein [Dehalococcoidia bacterium]
MEYKDKTLTCSDCGLDFTFGAGEQEFFASKGFVNEPGRCPDCRASRKQNRFGNNGGGYRQQRQMHPATCASCGKDCEVPFEPRDGRPVYCSDCYTTVRR